MSNENPLSKMYAFLKQQSKKVEVAPVITPLKKDPTNPVNHLAQKKIIQCIVDSAKSFWLHCWPISKRRRSSMLDALHPLDVMEGERYYELMKDQTKELTPLEVSQGYRFCCEWDGLLIHASHPEADCCGCLKEFRKLNKIEDFEWSEK